MPKQPNNIRDLREFKNLSQDKVAEACGLTYSKFVRIEEGLGRTTPEEVREVLTVLKGMEPGTRKLPTGRRFNDPEKQAAVEAARANGGSVAEAIGLNIIPPARAPRKKTTSKAAMAEALSKKSSKA